MKGVENLVRVNDEDNKTKTNTTSTVKPIVNKFTSFELENSTASWTNQVENKQKYQTETLKTSLISRETHNNNKNLENNKHIKDTEHVSNDENNKQVPDNKHVLKRETKQ
ncbi:10594_t:CDS:2 [Dentiscutata heterogama]|uniref:10594_t:CDS:1 n=1 Tax=Dentiscutata heterogama TaxID=1316150 RepID=A0ACA9KFE4_9GLOM|nr:10594_t:CDS:2 [Dentiscutata heterogama]